MSRRTLVPTLFLSTAAVLAGCGGHGEGAVVPGRAADGSWRMPAAGGSFASWNERFPEALEKVVRGEAPSREVWAGLDDGALDNPTHRR